MISNNVIQRVFHIQYGQGTGTCFALEVNGRQYLITAKHVIDDLQTGDIVSFYRNQSWLPEGVTLIGHSVVGDVSVFAINGYLPAHPVRHDADIFYGQDIYFLGFPYGLNYEVGQANNGFPLPLVKAGIISGFVFNNSTLNTILLDGHNNPGYSGGPVVSKIPNTNHEFNFISVISGFRADEQRALINNQPSAITYRSNTGIIISYPIRLALDLIEANPIGFQIPQHA